MTESKDGWNYLEANAYHEAGHAIVEWAFGGRGRPTRTSISAAGTTVSAAAPTRPRLRRVPTRCCQDAMGSSSVAVISSGFFFEVKASRRRAFLSILHLPNLFSGEFWRAAGPPRSEIGRF